MAQRNQKNNILDKLGKKITGEIKIPGDKSISIRAFLVSNIFHGDFELKNFNFCNDTKATINCINKLCNNKKEVLTLNCDNSATTMRLISGILCGMYTGTHDKFILTGDSSLKKRPMDRIIKPLTKMGADIASKTNGTAPLYINFNHRHTPLHNLTYTSNISSAQVKSCLELAAFCSKVKLKYNEPIKSRDHTSKMLKYFQNTETHIYEIPSDISIAAFFITNAILYKGSNIKLKNIGINPTRIGFLRCLKKMGVKYNLTNNKILQGEKIADISICNNKGYKLNAINVSKNEIPSMIDEVTLIALLLAFANGTSTISGLSELRLKESDRFKAITDILSYMKIKYNVKSDSIIIYGNPNLSIDMVKKNKKVPKALISSKDHRILILLKILGINNIKYKKFLRTSI